MSSSSVSSVASAYAPWRKGVAWWVILLQGILLAGLGIWALWKTEHAIAVILIGIGLYLVLMGIWLIFQALRGNEQGFSIFGLLASGGGMTAGLALIMPLLVVDHRDPPTLMVAFGVALVVIGILALMGVILERRTGRLSWMGVLRSAAYIAIGIILIMTIRIESAEILNWIAYIAIGLGVLLIIYSLLLMRSQRPPSPPATAPAAPPPAAS